MIIESLSVNYEIFNEGGVYKIAITNPVTGAASEKVVVQLNESMFNQLKETVRNIKTVTADLNKTFNQSFDNRMAFYVKHKQFFDNRLAKVKGTSPKSIAALLFNIIALNLTGHLDDETLKVDSPKQDISVIGDKVTPNTKGEEQADDSSDVVDDGNVDASQNNEKMVASIIDDLLNNYIKESGAI